MSMSIGHRIWINIWKNVGLHQIAGHIPGHHLPYYVFNGQSFSVKFITQISRKSFYFMNNISVLEQVRKPPTVDDQLNDIFSLIKGITPDLGSKMI